MADVDAAMAHVAMRGRAIRSGRTGDGRSQTAHKNHIDILAFRFEIGSELRTGCHIFLHASDCQRCAYELIRLMVEASLS